MQHWLRRILFVAAILGVAVSGPAQAQNFGALVGTWGGTIGVGDDAFEMAVRIRLDRTDHMIGIVSYSQCNGVWTDGTWQGSAWRLQETIMVGEESCPVYSEIALTERDGVLHVVMRAVQFGEEYGGPLYRINEAEFEAALAGADAADNAYAGDFGWCESDLGGIEYGQARNERWFIDGDPIGFGAERYVKVGSPRVLAAEDLLAFADYEGAFVYATQDAGAVPETIYVLIGAPRRQAEIGDCEYQSYARAR